MVPVVAPRFYVEEPHECNDERERAFIEALHSCTENSDCSWESWPRPDRFLLSHSKIVQGCVVRTLRIDFDGSVVWLGDDETHQFATDLDASRPDVYLLEGFPVHVLAAAAAYWMEYQTRGSL
ncbi:MAG TPA: hypothetical protein VGE52_21340 [Pirellulales bacterium]